MIKNRNLDRDAKRRVSGSVRFDLSGEEGVGKLLVIHAECAILIKKIFVCYSVATDSNNDITALQVGTPGALTTYYNTAPAISTAAYTELIAESVAPYTEVPKQTAIIASLAAGTCTNTGEVDVAIEYEVIDTATA
jgi:hypothetical protein